jgi:hypothetical protein
MAESCLHSRNLGVHTHKQTKEKKKKRSKDIHRYSPHLHGVGSYWDMGLGFILRHGWILLAFKELRSTHTKTDKRKTDKRKKEKRSKDIHQYTLHLHGVGSHWDMGLYLDMAESCLHSRNLVVHTQKQKKEQKKKQKNQKKPAARGVPKWSPTPVLTAPDAAW